MTSTTFRRAAVLALACALAASAAQSQVAYRKSEGGYQTNKTVQPNDGLPTSTVPFSVTAAPTVTAASAYASGNVVGGLQTFTSALRQQSTDVAGSGIGSALLQHVTLNFKSSQTAQTDLLLFSANPTNSTFTDKAALAVNTADFDKVIAVVHISDCTNLGTPSSCQSGQLAIPVRNATAATLYGVLVTRGTPTFTATTDLALALDLVQ